MKPQSRAGLVEGKVALVTGAGSGIGRASAILFAREGAAGVLVVDTNRYGADETVETIVSEGGEAGALVADITRPGDVDAMIAEVTRRWGRLDPLGRLGDPFELAEAVVWLSSDRSSFVTGERLLVDGGFYSAHQRRPKDGSIMQSATGPADRVAAPG